MDIAIQAFIGLIAGLLGGLLGLGGSTIIIPGMILYLSYSARGYSGSQQHLLQAAAMICNVFITAPAIIIHHRADAIIRRVLYGLIPSAFAGVFLGVTISNSSYFSRQHGRYLAMILAGFLLYVAAYNGWRLWRQRITIHQQSADHSDMPLWKPALAGFPMGLTAGLLGIGGGVLCVPAQQIILRLPLKQAIANSTVTILFASAFGAVYKNATLSEHGFTVIAAIKLAALLIPTAIIGSLTGSRLSHILPVKLLRIIFIVFMGIIAIATFNKAYHGNSKSDVPKPKISSYFHPAHQDHQLVIFQQP